MKEMSKNAHLFFYTQYVITSITVLYENVSHISFLDELQ